MSIGRHTDLPDLPGVYRVNCGDGFYLGSSQDMRARASAHLRQLRLGIHHSAKLQAAFDVHGETGVEFQVVERCRLALLTRREGRWMKFLKPPFNTNMIRHCSACTAGGLVPLAVYLPQETIDEIKRIADEESRRPGNMARVMIEEWIEQQAADRGVLAGAVGVAAGR